MVKVKLVEKKVNSHVGKVIVVKATVQYRAPGMICMAAIRKPMIEKTFLSAIATSAGAIPVAVMETLEGVAEAEE